MPDEQTLAQRVRAKYPGQYDDLSDAELETRVLAKHPEYGDLRRTKADEGDAKLMASHEKPVDRAEALDTAMGVIGRAGLIIPGGDIGEAAMRLVGNPKNAPALGAAAASAATGGAAVLPAALAATAGGAGGSVAKNAAEYFAGIKPAPSQGEMLTDAAKEGAIQGATQAAGGAIAKGAGALGRGMYTMALGAPKALRAEFPGLVQTGIEEGVIPATQAGVTKATAARTASSKAAADIVANSPAAQAGIRIPTRDVTQGLNPLRTEVAARPEANVARDAIGAFEANMMASHPRGFNLQELVKTKSAAQDAAEAAYEAAKTSGAAGMSAEANEAIAKRARGIIEHFAPEVGPQNAKTQALIGLQRAMKDASLKPYVLRGVLGAGSGIAAGVRERDPIVGLETGVGTFLATDPRVLGTAGMMLGRTGGGQGQIPANVLRAALLQLMGNSETEPSASTP